MLYLMFVKQFTAGDDGLPQVTGMRQKPVADSDVTTLRSSSQWQLNLFELQCNTAPHRMVTSPRMKVARGLKLSTPY